MKKMKVLALTVVTVIFMMILSGCAVQMPVPEVEEGKFNISVTYEVNGEEKTYAGVYVCKYKGTYVAVDGRGRNWEGYFEDNTSVHEFAIQTTDDGVIFIDFNLNPQYFMSDPNSVHFDIPQPKLYIVYKDEGTGEVVFNDEVDFMAEYGVQILGYEYAAPIENKFQEKWSFAHF
jgi:hypothetical protein